MLQLLFPAAMIAGEFMDKDDRQSASGFLIVQPHAVISGSKSHGELRFQHWRDVSRSMETPPVIISGVADKVSWSWRMFQYVR
jgi:hypothetical protein